MFDYIVVASDPKQHLIRVMLSNDFTRKVGHLQPPLIPKDSFQRYHLNENHRKSQNNTIEFDIKTIRTDGSSPSWLNDVGLENPLYNSSTS